jgi:hypothetical protein
VSARDSSALPTREKGPRCPPPLAGSRRAPAPGPAGRTPEQVLWEEKRREDELRALDIGVVRIADPDLGSGWPAVEARIASLVATPGPTTRRFSAVPRVRGILRAG